MAEAQRHYRAAVGRLEMEEVRSSSVAIEGRSSSPSLLILDEN